MKQLDIEEYERAAERTAVDVRVFLAGPYINPNGMDATLLKQNTNLGTQARYAIWDRLKTVREIKATLGEHEKLEKIYTQHFGHLNNAALAEMAHVMEKTDCVIILPSSPGSFCELGYFCASKTVCSKMLIIVDKNYENTQSYLMLGPLRLAKDNGALIEYVFYHDHEKMWEAADKFLNNRRQKILASKYMVA